MRVAAVREGTFRKKAGISRARATGLAARKRVVAGKTKTIRRMKRLTTSRKKRNILDSSKTYRTSIERFASGS